MHFTIAALVAVALAAPVLAQSEDEKTTLNDIGKLCTANFGMDPDVVFICTKEGTSNVFTKAETTYLRNSDDHICCEGSMTCVVSNGTIPEVGCWDPKDNRVSTDSDVSQCNLTDGFCTTSTGSRTYSTKGVTVYTSVKDGKGVEGEVGGSNSGGGGSGTSSSDAASESGKSAAAALSTGLFGALTIALGAAIAMV